MDMDRVEVVDVVALGGADSITVDDLSGTQLRRANIDLSVQGVGDGQPDVVTVEGTTAADRVRVDEKGGRVDVSGPTIETRLVAPELIDRLQVNTRDGRDRVYVEAAARALIDVLVAIGGRWVGPPLGGGPTHVAAERTGRRVPTYRGGGHPCRRRSRSTHVHDLDA
jgi:hypothetical protein